MESHLQEPLPQRTVSITCKHCEGKGTSIHFSMDEGGTEHPYEDECDFCEGHGTIEMDEEEYDDLMRDHIADSERD